jgi:polyisoprenoid-binding protein YceI
MKTSIRLFALLALASGLVSAAAAAVETYQIDPVHSSVGFTIRHFVSKVPGSFTTFSGTITVDRDNMENNQVSATIDVGSLSTANEKRDAHVKSPDFLDFAKYTTITFKSTAWKKTGDDTYDVTGDLTIKGVTKSVVLKVTSSGFAPGMQGAMLSGWEATTTIKKSDFGAAGPGMMAKAIGDDVAVTIDIEADLKK